MLSQESIRRAIDIEYRLLDRHRPAGVPTFDPHGPPPGFRRRQELRREARERVLRYAGLEGLLRSNYARD